MILRVLPFLVILCVSLQAHTQIRVAKVSLSSAAIGALGVSFEKVRDKQYSWQVGIVYRPNYSGPDYFLIGKSFNFELTESSSTGWAFHLEHRSYTSKARQQPVKPYIALYVQHHLLGLQAKYRKESFDYAFNADWNCTTLGVQYGVQWILNERLSFDWTMLGFGIGYNSLSGSAQTDPSSSVGEFEEQLSSIPRIGKRFGLEGKEGRYVFDEDFTGVSLRFALRLGYLF